MKVKNLWIMCGPSGSGKSYFAKNNLVNGDNWCYISRDQIRYSTITENDKYFSKEKLVFDLFADSVIDALRDPTYTDVIADATHLNWASRRKLLNSTHLLNNEYPFIHIIPVWVNTNIDTSLKRNENRTGKEHVPEEEIRKMYARRRHPRYDEFKYTAIMEVNG